MAGRVDYKQKYEELKARFMSSVDIAWRDGYMHGAQDSQVEQAQQESQQADMMSQQQAAAQSQIGQESGQPESEQEGEAPVSQNPNGDELDQHINKLESMLGKSEISAVELQDLKKTLNDIRSLQVQISLAKSMQSLSGTKLGRLNKSISFSPKVQANLPEVAKNSLSLQEKIVQDVFAKWEKDEAKATNDITSALNIEGIVKKD